MARSFLTKVARAAFAAAGEMRSSLENPQVPLSYPAEWLLDIFNGGRTDSGIRVSEMTALQVGTIYACVNIISNGFSSLPLHVYERVVSDKRSGKKIAATHSLYDLLHNEPNPEMTTHSWLKVLMVHALLWGNAFAEIQRDQFSNEIIGLWPRNPARTRAIRTIRPLLLEGDTLPPGTLLFETSDTIMGGSDLSSGTENVENRTGHRRLILAEDMIHVPGLSLDGRVGQSTTWLSRQAIGLSLATEKYGAKFFGNGARPAGVLEIPSAMEDKAIENLRRSWAESHGGENAFKVAVLEQGVKYTKIAATPNEGQMLETRNYQRAELCAIFQVPLHMVAAAEKGSGGKSNVEQNSIEFVLYCLNPWLVAWQQEMERKLFPKMGRSANKFFPHFDKRMLLYPDSESRAKFYQAGRQWGFLSANDVRELEDMNPVTDGSGDLYMVQVNMQPGDMPMTGGPGMEDHLDLKQQFEPAAPPAPAAPAVQPPQPPNPAKPSQGKGKKPATKGTKKRSLGGEQMDMPLYVMRHGTTDANEQDVYRGWGAYELDAQGKSDALKAADFLRGKGITRIITSSLIRHQQTATIVAKALGLNVETNDGLKTLNVGVFTGKKRADHADELQWYLDHADDVIPGGESTQQFADRNAKAFADVRTSNEDTGPVLVITSRSNIAVLENEGVTGADIKVAEPGGVYRMSGTNTMELIMGSEVPDTLAGT